MRHVSAMCAGSLPLAVLFRLPCSCVKAVSVCLRTARTTVDRITTTCAHHISGDRSLNGVWTAAPRLRSLCHCLCRRAVRSGRVWALPLAATGLCWAVSSPLSLLRISGYPATHVRHGIHRPHRDTGTAHPPPRSAPARGTTRRRGSRPTPHRGHSGAHRPDRAPPAPPRGDRGPRPRRGPGIATHAIIRYNLYVSSFDRCIAPSSVAGRGVYIL